jgi:parallel beta-helix repeat protein
MKSIRILSTILCFVTSMTGFLMAETVQVGGCRAIPADDTFSTIQAAVNASAAGTTILVCPGVYPEQVTINKALTMRGVRSGTSDAAIIVAPAGGIVANTTSLATGNPIAAQVLITGTADVDISNLTIDGANNKINACSPNLIGLFYRNASGTVNHVVVANQALVAADNGCQSGLGIFAQSGGGRNSTVTIENSHVQNYQKNGITGNEPGTRIHVIENTVVGQGSTTGAAENSIQIGFGASGKIVGNTVMDDVFAPDTINDSGDAAAGILVFASEDVTVSGNTVGNTQFGIAFVSDPVFGSADEGVITSNRVTATHIFDGIDLCSNSNKVHDNIINGSDEAGIHVDSSCGKVTGNKVRDNTINGACSGILVGTAAGPNSIDDNEFFNVQHTVLTADVCPAPSAAARSMAKTSATGTTKYQPARP